MTTKHSPQIALANAQCELDAARDACPHWDWDFESEEASRCECCYRLDDARRAMQRARKAAQV